jgi:hypothetical protein
MKCSLCEDCGWVCEAHPDRPILTGWRKPRRSFRESRSEPRNTRLLELRQQYQKLESREDEGGARLPSARGIAPVTTNDRTQPPPRSQGRDMDAIALVLRQSAQVRFGGPRARPLRRDADGLTARPWARAQPSVAPVIWVGIGVAWTLVLTVGIWIKERAISGLGHHLLRRSRREA